MSERASRGGASDRPARRAGRSRGRRPSAPAPAKRPTISDVAGAAGVSTATVSRVLNGAASVDAQLARRVHDAVAALGYRPSGVARSLRRERTTILCLIISDIRNHFFTDVVRGIEDQASAAGYSLVLCNSDEDLRKEAGYLDLVVAERMAGAIISPASSRDTRLEPLLERGIPVVAMDRHAERDPVDAVVVDSVAGSREATAHLLASGYRRIACVTGPSHTSTGAARLEGWRRAHADAGLAADEALVAHADFREAGGLAAARGLLAPAHGAPPDAFFVANSLMTVGVLAAIEEAGLRVPHDVGVVGFDDPSWARLMHPALTAVDQPTYEMGRTAAELLSRRIAGGDEPPTTVVLSPTLLVRESSVR
jgi:LacI family transcriptional regulator